jgi:hypothetical protein
MSRRTEELTITPDRTIVRAQARNERHRVHSQLHAVEGLLTSAEPDEIEEPGVGWKPIHHHDAERAKAKLAGTKRKRRHWKMKEWKRRTQLRRRRVLAERQLALVDDD